MPEGPEVHTVAKELKPILEGRVLCSVSLNKQRNLYSLEGLETPVTVKKVWARGKKIIFNLVDENGEDKGRLMTSFSMNGRWTDQWNNEGKNYKLAFEFDTDSKSERAALTLYYVDHRFGGVDYYESKETLRAAKEFKLGPCVITQFPSLEDFQCLVENYLKKRVKKPHQVVQMLMDQTWICGIGNYLKAEILYKAKISPYRLVKDLTEDDIVTLWTCIGAITTESLARGGLTISSYYSFHGIKGTYKCRVYGRKQGTRSGKKVLHCQLNDKKRTTWWCPEVQV